jgi:hypothetical protein
MSDKKNLTAVTAHRFLGAILEDCSTNKEHGEGRNNEKAIDSIDHGISADGLE